MALKFSHEFRILVSALRVIGLYSTFPIDKNRIPKILFYNSITTIFLIFLINSVVTYDIRNGGYEEAIKNTTIVTIFTTVFFNNYLLLRHQESFKKFVNFIDEDYIAMERHISEEKEIVLQYAKKGSKICKYRLISGCTTGAMFPLKPIILMIKSAIDGEFQRTQIFEMNYPTFIEMHKNEIGVYLCIFLIFIIVNIHATSTYVGFNPLISIFLLHICGQIDILNLRIQKLMLDKATEREIHEKLKNINRKLQYFYSFLHSVQSTFIELLEFIMKSMMCLLPFVAFQIVQSLHRLQFSMEFLCLFLGCIIQFFIPCYYGNLLTDKSNSLREAIYACGWENNTNIQIRKTIMLMLTRCNIPLGIKTIFYPLNFETCAEVCRQAYAIFNIINATQMSLADDTHKNIKLLSLTTQLPTARQALSEISYAANAIHKFLSIFSNIKFKFYDVQQFSLVLSPKKMILNFENAFKTCNLALRFNGSHPSIPRDKKWLAKFIFLNTLSFFCCYFLINSVIYYDIRNKKYTEVFKNVSMTIIFFMVIFKYLVLIRHQDSFINLINSIDKDYTTAVKQYTSEEKKIVLYYIKRGKHVYMFWFVAACSTGVMFPLKAFYIMIHSYCQGDFKLTPMFDMSYPKIIDAQKEDLYVFCLLFLLCFSFDLYATSMYVGFDPLAPILLLHVCGQIEILNLHIRNLMVIVTDVNEIRRNLKIINRKMQTLYSFLNSVRSNFIELFEINMKTTTFILPLAAFQIVQSLHHNELNLEFFCFFCAGFIHFFIPCYYSNLLMEKGDNLREAIYSCGWENQPDVEIRKTVLLMLTRCSVPLGMRTIFHTVNLQTFAEMSRQAYAIFNAMNASCT
ncbi:uncharacterized protein [Battus philenor]|uniref:uncharacterized protein n=1 Tax=Battus philenor TaxID=42288 RepID=UPI0035D09D24